MPDGFDAAIDVDGPDDFFEEVTATTVIEEAPVGSYAISAATVGDDAIYVPEPEETTVDVERQANVDVTIDYDAIAGDLQVDVEGLPDGVDHDLELTGNDDTWEIPQSGLVEDLYPTSYTISAADVEDGDILYEASDVDVQILSDQTVDATVEYIIDPGYLDVDVQGLPDGVDHDIDVIDADGETTSVPQSGELTLEPGAYDLEPHNVTDALTTYEADATSVDIASGETAEASVDYEFIPGELPVDIQGLPAGVGALVELVGDNQSQSVSSSTTVAGLEPGTYSVDITDVTDGPATYEGTSTSVDVESGINPELIIEYDVIYGGLSVDIGGELGGNPADVTVTDNNGFYETIDSDHTFDDLLPGDYTVSAADVVDSPATYGGGADQTITVNSADTATANVDYSLISGTLQVSTSGLPSNLSPDIQITGNGFDQTYSSDVTVDSTDPGDYTATFGDVEDDGVIYTVYDSPMSTTVFSDDTAHIDANYEPIPGEIEVVVEEYGDPDLYEVHISADTGFGEVVDGPATFSDVLPGDYTVTVETLPQDSLGNEGYVTVTNDAFTLDSNGSQTIELEVGEPTLVTTEADDGPGSLRDIIDNSVDGTGIEFYDDVEHVVLSGDEIAIDHSIELFGTEGDAVTIDGDDNSRHFNVSDDAYLGLYDLVITGGDSSVSGGAIRLGDDAELFATHTIFEENSAGSDGGALYVSTAAVADIRESIFRHNEADRRGGAIATSGGGSSVTTVDTRQSLLHDNESGTRGGALYLTGDNTRIEDSTLVDNTAGTRGGAVYIYWHTTTIIGSTITGNSADTAGGVLHFGDSVTDLLIGRTIVAGNTATGNYQDIGYSSSLAEDAISLGYNIIGIEDGGGGFVDGENNDQVGSVDEPLDPLLEALADNGGFSMTRAPQDTSPARAAIPADECADIGDVLILHDQRGVDRPAGGACSIGAYELDSQLETFENADMSATSYQTGSFVGDNDVTWNYQDVRRSPSDYTIDGTSVMLDGDPSSSITSETLTGGISSLSMELAQGFTSDNDRQVEVFVNGDSVGTSQVINEDGDVPYPVHEFAIEDIDVDGDFDIEIQSIGDAQIVIDNLSWR